METSQLTFTRFIAAIMIVIFHFGSHVFPFNIPFIAVIVNQGFLGVGYFFVLSGFVMMLAYGKRNVEIDFKTYVKSRAARILPLYYLALLLILVYYFIRIDLMLVKTDFIPNITDILFNTLLIQNWPPKHINVVNTASWTLCVEAFFYVMFPLLFNQFYKKFSLKIIAFTVVSFFVISQIIFHVLLYTNPSLGHYWDSLPLLHLNVFMAGNLIGLLFIKYRGKSSNNFLIPILISAVIMFGVLYFPVKGISYADGLFIIFQIPVLLLIAYDNGHLAKFFRKKSMIYLGEISYGIYILQFPVYFFFTAALTFFHFKINQPLFYVYVVILIVVSGLSFNYVEKPLRERIKKW